MSYWPHSDPEQPTRVNQAPSCPSCHRPSQDGALCTGEGSCTEHMERSLGDIAALAFAAAVGYSGLDRVTRRSLALPDPDPDANLPQTASIQRLPWNQAISTSVRALHAVMVSQIRMVIEERRIPAQRIAGPACILCTHSSCRATRVGGWPADSLPSMAAWLLGQVSWLRRHLAADEHLDEIKGAVQRLERSMDRAPDLLYAGPCTVEVDHDGELRQCAHDLYAEPGAEQVVCPACRAEYATSDRRSWLLQAAEDVIDTATAISRALTGLGSPVTPDRIRQWVARGRLLSRGSLLTGKRADPTYRVGDVQKLLLEDARAAERRAQRHADRSRSA